MPFAVNVMLNLSIFVPKSRNPFDQDGLDHIDHISNITELFVITMLGNFEFIRKHVYMNT